MFLFLFITYPSTCSAILRILPLACHELCTESSCTQYLKADYSIKCEGDEYNCVKLFAFAASSYIVVLPGLVFLALWRRRGQQLSRMRKLRDVKPKEETNPVNPEFGKYGDTEAAEGNNEDTCDDDERNEDNVRNGSCCVAHFPFFVPSKFHSVVNKLFHLHVVFLGCRCCRISREPKRWFACI